MPARNCVGTHFFSGDSRATAYRIFGRHRRMAESEVEFKEEGYAFLKLPQCPKDIFASRAESKSAEWDRLYTGARQPSVGGDRVLSLASRPEAKYGLQGGQTCADRGRGAGRPDIFHGRCA